MPSYETRRNMHLIRYLPDHATRQSAVAIGNFDGLHLGHAAVIAAMKAAASELALVPTALTFEPHPRRFFAPSTAPFRLTRLGDKLAALHASGVAQIAMPRFDAAFARMPAEMFLDDILHKRLGAKVVVTGENFAFGHQRRGGVAMLNAWGIANHIRIITVPPLHIDGEICSSSAIRKAIGRGTVAHAAKLLGHPYALRGRVVHGDGRGRTIGFPTANIHLSPDLLLPAYGVYAVRARMAGTLFEGVANIGIRPTVAVSNAPSLEVHLFDTVQEIYGEKLEILFVDNIRNERKFDSLDALKSQIARDAETARHMLAATSPHAIGTP